MARTTFILNDELVETDVSPGTLLLDYLRNVARRTGTKEGCKEGDCGACAVMVGDLRGLRVIYQPVTSCLVPVADVHGRHVVTAEGLRTDPPGSGFAGLNPAQKALVEFGGTQCGFCTPGIAVSLSWWMLGDAGAPTIAGFKRALSGHLCRCTGYASILRGGEALIERFGPGGAWAGLWDADDRVSALVDAGMLPQHFERAAERLSGIANLEPAPAPADADYCIAGGTDLYVQRGEQIPDATVSVLRNHADMDAIRHDGTYLRVGALTTFEAFAAHPDVRRLLPDIDAAMFLVASLQVRNRATLSGNIVNASPIGDMTNLLQALDAQLVIDGGSRTVPLRTFYTGYKRFDLRRGELVSEILLPESIAGCRVNFEKLSKRTCLDIATVNSSACLKAESGVFVSVGIAAGGVAPTPLFLRETSAWMVGQPVSAETALQAARIADDEIAPISDIRGSAAYKRLLNRQFIYAHFLTLYPDLVDFDALHRSAS